ITADAVFDTLGGGTFEFQVIDCAREALARGESGTRLEPFSLGGRSGQCCGGFVHVLVEVFAGAEMTVALVGAVHVGQALAQLLAPLPWQVLWHDSRPDAFPAWAEQQPRLNCLHAPDPATGVSALSPGAHALVMTHDHAQDRRLMDALLARGDCASIGLIGSHSKWASFRRRLRDAGHSDEALARVRCPIGIPGAQGKRPYEIALSVAAELLTLLPSADHPDRRGIDPERLRDVFGSRPLAPSSLQSPSRPLSTSR
ncbi:MAG: xanthine dehydrogenase accessory protein XdhC, partial [Halomonas sp.]|nr:xanthine dehydrogenase accessory protein XdhC [Halomonas sp.]